MIVGIDISKQTIDSAYQNETAWVTSKHEQNEQGYAELIATVGGQVSWFVMEATGSYFLRFASYLTEKGYRVAVINAKTIHYYGKMRLSRGKTDKQDAQLIARYGKDNEAELKKWSLPEQDITQLQQLQSALSLLKEQRTMNSNHLEALAQHPNQDGVVINEIKGLLVHLKQHIQKLDAEIERLVLEKWSALYERLLSIKGIGKITATTLLVMTHGFTRFTKVKEFLSYIGLAPKPFQSGSSVKGKSYISKMGGSRIRQLLYLCAWTAKRLNKPCVTLYQRLKEKGKPEKLIKIAIAHKLLRQAFAIALSERSFDESFI